MRLNLLVLALVAFLLQPAAPTEIRLIVKGDDMGAAHGINVGTIKAYKEGILRTTNVIVAGPWFLEAAKLLRENPGLDVGVHLALTSEWDNVKWRPLTHAPSIVDADGYFFPAVVPRPGYPPEHQHQGRPVEDRRDRTRVTGAARRREEAPAAGDVHVVPHGIHDAGPGGA